MAACNRQVPLASSVGQAGTPGLIPWAVLSAPLQMPSLPAQLIGPVRLQAGGYSPVRRVGKGTESGPRTTGQEEY